jgi:hypothetical protein
MTWREWIRRELESIPSALINFLLILAVFGIVFGTERIIQAMIILVLLPLSIV